VTFTQFQSMKERFGIPVKPKDKLGPAYIATYGNLCVEVDAIPSDENRNRLESAITRRIDMKLWEASETKEEQERKEIETLVQEISKQFK
jgi:hypothetical protein